jgi:hypothetical protein
LGIPNVRDILSSSRLQLTYSRSTLTTFSSRCIQTNTAHLQYHLQHTRMRC